MTYIKILDIALVITMIIFVASVVVKAADCEEIFNYDTNKCETYKEQNQTLKAAWVEFYNWSDHEK